MPDRIIRSKTEARKLQREARKSYDSDVELAFFLQDWDDAYNVGGLFRVADACGANAVVSSGKTPVPPNPQISVTSLGNHRRVAHRHFARHDDAIAYLREEGYKLIAVEISANASPYFEVEFCSKVCLVLGNEERGLYSNTLKSCSSAVFIPMAGKGRSLNVHVAAAVVAFHALLPKDQLALGKPTE